MCRAPVLRTGLLAASSVASPRRGLGGSHRWPPTVLDLEIDSIAAPLEIPVRISAPETSILKHTENKQRVVTTFLNVENALRTETLAFISCAY
ncbi:hypothetical protein IMZ48_10475 [Candidatus Bathyarchaeota archaeon]|nr:hypothetical protein [Candidatus Bathyarchaeota archaeon]